MNSPSTWSLYLLTTSRSLGIISEALEYSKFKASKPIFIVCLASSSSDLLILVKLFLSNIEHASFSIRRKILSVNLACLKYTLAIVFFMWSSNYAAVLTFSTISPRVVKFLVTYRLSPSSKFFSAFKFSSYLTSSRTILSIFFSS